MFRKILSVLIIALISHVSFASAKNDKSCNDSHRVYKICESQNDIYQRNLSEAKKSKKLLLVQFGFEECSWCKSLHKILEGSLSDFVKQDFKVVFINIREDSGKELFNKIKGRYNKSHKKTGWPFWIAVNPSANTSDFFDTDKLEDNSHGKGHDEKKVRAALEGFKVNLIR
ncbi:MAG: DUF255 domain-containing protein [Bdellovibrionaceae bacterium]|nr:DUF255 domain-containing protein [Pseudobdellovibrionaceae bacterium]